MYIRKTTKIYKGKTYTNYLLVESVHTPKGPRQRILCSLGSLSPAPPEQWLDLAHRIEASLEGQASLSPADADTQALVEKARRGRKRAARESKPEPSTDSRVTIEPERVRVEEAREAGPVHAGHQVWEQLGLSEILQAAGLPERACQLSEAMTLNRLIFPLSEHAMPELKEDMEALKTRVEKGQLKKVEKIHQAIGRLQERYPRVARYYRIDYDAERKTLGWEEDTEKKAIATKLDGGYVLKTDRQDLTADEIWRTYILLTRVETAFRSMQSPLMEHPLFHHLQRRTQTHIFLCVLAYHLLAAIEKRFLDRGIHTSWWTLRQQLSTHQVITVVLPTADGRVLKIRKGTTPELAHKEIYAALKIPTEVMKPVKTWHEVSPIVTE